MIKSEILKKNYEFKRVFSKGKCYRGNYLEVFVEKTKKEKNQLGIAVSTKVGNSVKRNRIKRLIRENYRNIENRMLIGYNFVILWNKNIKEEEATFHNIKKDLENVFLNAEILKKDD